MLQLLLVLGLGIGAGAVEMGLDRKTIGSEAVTQSDSAHTLYGIAGFIKCVSDEHVEPANTQEVSDIVRKLNAAGRPFKVRATRRGGHTPNGFACPGAGSSSAKLPAGENPGVSNGDSTTHSVTILMHLMNRVLAVDWERHRLTVEAGMTLQNLADAAVRNGLSIPVGVLPVYGNLTVSGVIAVGAHGSGAGVDSALGDLVAGLKWVNGKGEIITSDIDDEKGRQEIRALIGGVGALGVLTEATLQLLPPGALAQVEIFRKDDANIAADVQEQLQSLSPNMLYFWRPDLDSYRAFVYKPLETGDVPVHPYHPNGRGALLVPGPQEVATAMTYHMRDYTLDVDDSGPTSDFLNAQGCALSEAVLNIPGFQDGGVFIENATISTSHAMIAEECYPHCIWDLAYYGSTVEDSEFTIKLSDLDEWVKDVKSVIKAEEKERQEHLDRRYGKGKVKLCLNPGYFWLRFGQASKNLLATTAAHDEPVVYVMMTFFASSYAPYVPPKMDHISEVLEQLTLCKYKGRPHYGKNTDRVFTHPKCHVRDNFPEENVSKLLALREQHDPNKVFESELFNRLIERRGPVYGDRCTLRHKCYCTEDSHCADGFKCVPSVSFPEYKTCKVQFPQKNQHFNLKEEL